MENALRWDKPHHSHQLVGDAIAFARRVGARRTYLVHANHDIGKHNEINRRLPDDIRYAYDGLQISGIIPEAEPQSSPSCL